MAYQVLARKYRPQRFADVAGQGHVTVTLMNALIQGRIAHGYIFSGHRGIGKTTIARILAMALNCRNLIGSSLRPSPEPCEVCESCTEIRAGNAVDVIEIDAATNRGIDEIRELRDAARYRPARDKYKIYILDEAHQITDAAFNALLKTLEEPPDHIVFMMATTQPEDIPQTVRSRCQHFSFHAVKMADILTELRGIAEHEGVDADEGALSLLAEAGDGSMRDALSVMDQAIASAPTVDGRAVLDASQIRELMGSVPNAVFERILGAVDGNRSAEVITVANDLMDAGNSPAQLARQFVRFLRNCLVAKVAGIGPDGMTADGSAAELLQISADEQRRAGRSASLFGEEELTRFLQVMLRTFDELGYRQEQRFHFELGLIKLVHLRRLLPVEELLSQLPTATRAGGEQPKLAAGRVTAPAGSSVRVASTLPTITANAARATAKEITRPAFSPFETDSKRKRFDGVEPGGPEANVPRVAPAVPPAAMERGSQLPAATEGTGVLSGALATSLAEPSVAEIVAEKKEASATAALLPEIVTAPESSQTESMPVVEAATTAGVQAPEEEVRSSRATAAELQARAVDALLKAKSQSSAAEAMEEAEWSLDDGMVAVQTSLSKIMLQMTVNAEAEKIIRGAIRERGLGDLKLVLLPGAGAAKAAAKKKTRPAGAGSVQAKAEEHPIVQQAQRLFNAEIRNVIDLSEGK